MAATVSAWAKPGAWALESEEHEADLLQQQKNEQTSNGGTDSALSDFPSLASAATSKPKKKSKGQTLSLQQFSSLGSVKQPASTNKGLTPNELLALPTGPRQRSAEELDRSRLGGGFRSHGSSYDRPGRGSSDEQPRRTRESNRDFAPSRADETDDWGAAKKSTVGNGFERRDRGERGAFFSDSSSRADDVDNWAAKKSFVPSEGRRHERRGGFESNGGGADTDNWTKKKEEEVKFSLTRSETANQRKPLPIHWLVAAMEALKFLPQWIFLLIVLQFILLSASIWESSAYQIPRLSPTRGDKIFHKEEHLDSATSATNRDLRTYFYEQTLDHFNYAPESYATFRQKYIISTEYWSGADSNSPIFAYLGAESELTISTVDRIGFLVDNAPRFKALLVYLEHRFYGDSIPFGYSKEEVMRNSSIRGYFSSAQAIADYAEVLLHVKDKFSLQNSPIIVIGGSYGGMLATWFRLKYPHIAIGALASSAPILYFDNLVSQDAYDSIVTTSFKDASESCYETIKKSWSEIDKIASEENGLSILTQRFNVCKQLKDSSALKDYLVELYESAAQYNKPWSARVSSICRRIDGAPDGTDMIDRIYAGVFGDKLNNTCHNITKDDASTLILNQWNWQTCSEMVMPIGNNNSKNMVPLDPFNLTNFINDCKDIYGVPPRPHWTTTCYGGHDIRLVLQKFGSNIIFSNGLADPYSSGGVLEDLSDSLLAIYTTNGSHCMDLYSERTDDPDWLKKQRKIEVAVIEAWIAGHNADLLVLNHGGKIPHVRYADHQYLQHLSYNWPFQRHKSS